LQELVGWAELIARDKPLPGGPPRRGAPEFDTLRARMRSMAAELREGRARAVEAERAAAMRETARQVAHELKNPLTPIRFAIDRLRRDAAPDLQEAVDVLRIEADRLDAMATSFAQFGRLPDGARAPVDLADLARYSARSVVPEHVPLELRLEDDLPLVSAQYDAIARAFTNVLLNAVHACDCAPARASITVSAERRVLDGNPAVALVVSDTGCGIDPAALGRIWDPYVTTKAGGTGLGLAIVRQTIVAHGGTVGAESAPDSGTSITLVLPIGTFGGDRSAPSRIAAGVA
jgi:signal transduction histidine kinase